jgi:hypothetical protein
VALVDEVEAAAARAVSLAEDGETVAGVLPTEPQPGRRVYLCAFHTADGHRTWLALDPRGDPVVDRAAVRDAVSIAALCEVAAELAAGGDLDELRSRLVGVRLTEALPGTEDAETALDELERTIGQPPQLATPARLDELGAAARRLEQALDPAAGSSFAAAMQAASAAVEALAHEVEASYRIEFEAALRAEP